MICNNREPNLNCHSQIYIMIKQPYQDDVVSNNGAYNDFMSYWSLKCSECHSLLNIDYLLINLPNNQTKKCFKICILKFKCILSRCNNIISLKREPFSIFSFQTFHTNIMNIYDKELDKGKKVGDKTLLQFIEVDL